MLWMKTVFHETDFNREGGMLDDENAGRNDRLWFFWHHHVSNFRGATLDNGEENNYCLDSNIKSKHFSPVISCSRSFKSLLQAQDLRRASNCAFKKGHHTISPHGKRVDVITSIFESGLKKKDLLLSSRPNQQL